MSGSYLIFAKRYCKNISEIVPPLLRKITNSDDKFEKTKKSSEEYQKLSLLGIICLFHYKNALNS